MLIVKVNKGGIERALKELKSKVIKTRQNNQLNEKKEYKKKSVKNRQILNKAKFKENFTNL
jgi:ribosomal protein S21